MKTPLFVLLIFLFAISCSKDSPKEKSHSITAADNGNVKLERLSNYDTQLEYNLCNDNFTMEEFSENKQLNVI